MSKAEAPIQATIPLQRATEDFTSSNTRSDQRQVATARAHLAKTELVACPGAHIPRHILMQCFEASFTRQLRRFGIQTESVAINTDARSGAYVPQHRRQERLRRHPERTILPRNAFDRVAVRAVGKTEMGMKTRNLSVLGHQHFTENFLSARSHWPFSRPNTNTSASTSHKTSAAQSPFRQFPVPQPANGCYRISFPRHIVHVLPTLLRTDMLCLSKRVRRPRQSPHLDQMLLGLSPKARSRASRRDCRICAADSWPLQRIDQDTSIAQNRPRSLFNKRKATHGSLSRRQRPVGSVGLRQRKSRKHANGRHGEQARA
ncbi:hypothetical protein IWZ00DRAFT_297047 [Phyllosticta capitalensis]